MTTDQEQNQTNSTPTQQDLLKLVSDLLTKLNDTKEPYVCNLRAPLYNYFFSLRAYHSDMSFLATLLHTLDEREKEIKALSEVLLKSATNPMPEDQEQIDAALEAFSLLDQYQNVLFQSLKEQATYIAEKMQTPPVLPE